MGCCESRNRSAGVEEIVCKIEKSLKISKLEIVSLDRLAHRHSSHYRISRMQFGQICADIAVKDCDDTFDFLLGLYDKSHESYSVQLVSTLGIIYGQGFKANKVEMLFQNYDIKQSGVLDESEVQQMVADITFICIQVILSFALTKVTAMTFESLKDYRQELISIKHTMDKYYTRIICDDEKTVKFYRFKNIFTKPEIDCLLNASTLRLSSKIIFDTISRMANSVQLMMDQDVTLDKKLVKKLSLKIAKSNNNIKK